MLGVASEILGSTSSAESISVWDRAFHYGDGVFETIPVINGKPLCWERHIDRLNRGCERLSLGMIPPARLLETAEKICPETTRSILKIIVSRGNGQRGYGIPSNQQPISALLYYPWPVFEPSWYHHGVAVRICQIRLGRNPYLAGIKHLNRLEQVLARSEWTDPDIAEGIMQDTDGWVIEGTMSNLFLVKEGCLRTPSLSYSGVSGVMRNTLLRIAEEIGLPIEVSSFSMDDIENSDEIFLSNSSIGIWPVSRVDGRIYRLGEITKKLQDLLLDRQYAVAPT